MSTECVELIKLYYAGKHARSLVGLRLAAATLREAHYRLTSAGFEHERRPLLAFRDREGGPLWCRFDGTTSADDTDHQIIRVNHYLHADGAMVRIFPSGEPRGRLVPPRVPSAIKSVMFRRTGTSASALTTVTTFNNEAFRVKEDGTATPKSRRAVYGTRFERDDPAPSYWSADRLYDMSIVSLRTDPVPDPLFQ